MPFEWIKAAEYYDTAEEFAELVRDANQQATSEFDQEFADSIRRVHLGRGLEAFMSNNQWKTLWRIADHVPPVRRRV